MKKFALLLLLAVLPVQAQELKPWPGVITPALSLSDLEGKPHKLAIYPPYGTSVRDGHGGFCFRAPEVWGAEVLSFLDTYLKN